MLAWNGKPHEWKMYEMENEAWRVKIMKFKTLENMLAWNGKPDEWKMDEMDNEAWKVKIIKFKTLENMCWIWSKLSKKSIVDQSQPFGLKWYFCVIFLYALVNGICI